MAKNTPATNDDQTKDAALAELSDDILRQIGSSGNAFADFEALSAALYGDLLDVSKEFGNGFNILTDKTALVGKKIGILKARQIMGDYGVFVSMTVITEDGGKYIVNDGSTGIAQQIKDFYQRTGRDGGFVVNNGFRLSEYDTCGNCGKPRNKTEEECDVCGDVNPNRGTGRTYYLDLSVTG